MMQFRGLIRIRGVNPYIHVQAKIARRLQRDWRKPLPVSVRINGQPKTPWRINMMPAGDGSFYLYLRNTVRNSSGTKVGDRVIVDMSFDGGYRGGPAHPLPQWFRTALGNNPRAKKAWSALIPSRKKEILRYFVGLKSTEAKARNLGRVLEVLSGSEARFMGRIWKHGK
jgi:Domain of unknown function (DUF1905)/Bacteriocin-protection, YdeI or OmpD-Associated